MLGPDEWSQQARLGVVGRMRHDRSCASCPGRKHGLNRASLEVEVGFRLGQLAVEVRMGMCPGHEVVNEFRHEGLM